MRMRHLFGFTENLEPINNFECVVCGETKDESDPHPVGEWKVCIECSEESILGLIQKAVNFEYHYPPAFGYVKIDVQAYKDVIPPDLLLRYQQKSKEYSTHATARIYCSHKIIPNRGFSPYSVIDVNDLALSDIMPSSGLTGPTSTQCGTFVGQRSSRGSDHLSNCDKCMGVICMICGAAVHVSDEHHCDLSGVSRQEAEIEAAFKDLVRGKDYQICCNETCRRRVLLGDGCNEITCIQSSCGAKFCFLCGKKVKFSHFAAGGCPRFGRPEGRHIHDQPGDIQHGQQVA